MDKVFKCSTCGKVLTHRTKFFEKMTCWDCKEARKKEYRVKYKEKVIYT